MKNLKRLLPVAAVSVAVFLFYWIPTLIFWKETPKEMVINQYEKFNYDDHPRINNTYHHSYSNSGWNRNQGSFAPSYNSMHKSNVRFHWDEFILKGVLLKTFCSLGVWALFAYIMWILSIPYSFFKDIYESFRVT